MVCKYSTLHWDIIFQIRRSSISEFQPFICFSNIYRHYYRTFSVWNGKRVFSGYFIYGSHFLWNGINCPFHCIPCLLLMILSWINTLRCNYCYCWTCVQEELFFPLVILLKFCCCSSLFYNPNPSWVIVYLIWCIHIDSTFRHSQFQRSYWQ